MQIPGTFSGLSDEVTLRYGNRLLFKERIPLNT